MRVNRKGLGPSASFVLGLSAVLALTSCVLQADDEGEIVAEDLGEREQAAGVVYKVGPSRQYTNLKQVASLLEPGDIVEVDGNATYSGGVKFTKDGTASNKIRIRGIRVNGERPVLSGGTNTVELNGNHYVFEGFDVTGGSSRCIFHHAHDITIRDAIVHDCPSHGVLGADEDSGSLLMEYVEVHSCGSGTTRHPVYIATDQSAYPGAVFRMQHCYVHDANGGNNVKTRAQRNEIYYNWIEGGLYKELELIGPDGTPESLAREDSDVVGNVFRKTHNQYVVRIGGDGTGQTWGRYRFMNNTFLLKQNSSAAIHVFDGVESLELHNNIFYRVGGGSVQVIRDDGDWASGSPVIGGTKNCVTNGTSVPGGLSQTIFQNNPGFVNVGALDFRLAAGSPLINAGANATSSPAGHAFPSPLALPLYHPPPGDIQTAGTAEARPAAGTLDLGAFEHGSGGPPPPPPPPSACQISDPGVWVNTPASAQTGSFTATWDVTPSAAGIDGVLGLSLGPKTAWTGLAAIVLFDVSGKILVRNGSTYQSAVSFYYSAGQTYKVKMVVNVGTKKYSVYVTPPGGMETLLASQYSFRTEQANVSQLDNWAIVQTEPNATFSACNFTLQ
jgi:hypothetical protein